VRSKKEPASPGTYLSRCLRVTPSRHSYAAFAFLELELAMALLGSLAASCFACLKLI